MEKIKFIPHFACLHGQKLKTKKLSAVVENISSKLEGEVDCLVRRKNYSIIQAFMICTVLSLL